MISMAWAEEGGIVGTQKNYPIHLKRTGMLGGPLEKIGVVALLVKNGMKTVLMTIGTVVHLVKIGIVTFTEKIGTMVTLVTHLFIMVGDPLECGINLHIILCPLDLGSPHGMAPLQGPIFPLGVGIGLALLD